MKKKNFKFKTNNNFNSKKRHFINIINFKNKKLVSIILNYFNFYE